ncbi:MAG: hypothetical protein MO852_00265 [Candidatus Devosia euplotis]|nr:hypothetical protein [Candidatus Devosia euplotis]
MRQTGSLIFGAADNDMQRPGRAGFLDRFVTAAQRCGIPHEILTATEIVAPIPQFPSSKR